MMNLSMSHPVPNFGDSFTITCYVCGMPSSKEWAQKARSRPTTPMKPYYPFLLQVTPTGGAVLREDGSTYLCAFCHASLEAQWNMYESQQVIPPPNRKYNIQKFICAVCGVETYRKRIRALPFQEFPFLEKQRQPGSITLGNNPLAVVCLDCSETLWAQSAEYDRWGLPVHKRHFNWMARPPPPEDSVEATVARLPSGETQLPRCPPTEPVLTRNIEPPAVKILETQISVKARSKGKGESPKLENSHNISSPTPQARKTSLTSTTPPSLEIVGNFHNQQPPVVTVAPMSSHTTVISLRKTDPMALSSGLIAQGSGAIFPQSTTSVYPPAAAYAPYVWGNATREATQRPSIEAYPYGTPGAEVASGAWPWIAHQTSDLIRYQTYVSTLQNRSRIVEGAASGSPTHTAGSSSFGSGSEPRYQAGSTSSTATGVLREQHERTASEEQRQLAAINSERRSGASTAGVVTYEELVYQSKGSPDPKTGKRSPKILVCARDTEKASTSASSSRLYPTHPKKVKDLEQSTSRSSNSAQTGESEKVSGGMSPSTMVTDGSTVTEDQTARREYHIPKKRNWHVFMKESQAASTSGGEDTAKTPPPQEMLVPHPKKKKTSLSECSLESRGTLSSRDSAMDLSVVPMDVSGKGSTQALTKGAGAKFRIEYLCQSTSAAASQQGGEGQGDDTAKRTSVIKCAPKVPPVPENTSQKVYSEEEEEDEEESQQQQLSQENTGSGLKEDQEKKKKIERKLSPASSSGNKSEEKSEDKDATIEDKMDDDHHDKKEKIADANKVDDGQREIGKEESEKENEGKRDRQRKDSSMNTDTDDDDNEKNEDLPNIEQFIKETVLELVSREREREKVQKELGNKQKEFLNELGLITPDKKIDLEIKSIVSRHEKNTLPPLPLRADTKFGRQIGKQLKELLLKVSLQDPTLFEEKPEAEKCDFMAELGMKTAQKSEKTKREIKWRVILMERMRRELRDAAARGVKHEWEKSEILKKFASCDLDSFFNSLSYAALQASEAELDNNRRVVNKTESSSLTGDGDGNGETGEDAANGNGVCINYPKYIPSYAVAGSSSELTTSQVKIENEEGEGDATNGETSEDTSSTAFVEPILKIPVVPPKHRLQSESSSATTLTSDTDDSEVGVSPALSSGETSTQFKFSLGVSGPYPLRIDSLIQCSNTYWQQMKRSIDEILNDLESSKEDVPLEDKSVHLDKLRKHLKSQLSDIKEIEKRFRATSKAICASRKKATN